MGFIEWLEANKDMFIKCEFSYQVKELLDIVYRGEHRNSFYRISDEDLISRKKGCVSYLTREDVKDACFRFSIAETPSYFDNIEQPMWIEQNYCSEEWYTKSGFIDEFGTNLIYYDDFIEALRVISRSSSAVQITAASDEQLNLFLEGEF